MERTSPMTSSINQIDQLQLLLTSRMQNSSPTNKFQPQSRDQLIQHDSVRFAHAQPSELEQALFNLSQSPTPPPYPAHQPQQFFYQQQPLSYNAPPNYRFSSSQTVIQQPRPIRPTSALGQSNTHSPHRQQQPDRSPYNPPPLHELVRHPSASPTTIPSRPIRPAAHRYQVPLLPPSPSIPTLSPSSTSSSASTPSPIVPRTHVTQRTPIHNIVHKPLPFYHILECIYERQDIFRYDAYRKQYISHDEFILPLNVCNQLALSSDYDPNLDTHTTNKCLLLRLVRIDQPPTFHGQYEDNLPVNVDIHVNGHILSNLPTPKPCTRLQRDLLRVGREIDITSHCMFNPILKNEITITWTYRLDNKNLVLQYVNAQYALHVFLAQRLSVKELRDRVLQKPAKFHHNDLVNILTRARATDSDLELEVSDQKLKLVCPIDQKRLKTPARTTTCQHLQCFDLSNYIALNEKANKWMCPVCNKSALYEDLQIDYYTDSILKSIQSDEITEISIDSNLRWTPIIPLNGLHEPSDSKSHLHMPSSSNDVILIDDD